MAQRIARVTITTTDGKAEETVTLSVPLEADGNVPAETGWLVAGAVSRLFGPATCLRVLAEAVTWVETSEAADPDELAEEEELLRAAKAVCEHW